LCHVAGINMEMKGMMIDKILNNYNKIIFIDLDQLSLNIRNNNIMLELKCKKEKTKNISKRFYIIKMLNHFYLPFWTSIPSFQSLQVPNLQKKEENVSKTLLKTINKKKTYYMSSVLKN